MARLTTFNGRNSHGGHLTNNDFAGGVALQADGKMLSAGTPMSARTKILPWYFNPNGSLGASWHRRVVTALF
jgi:hypothetical protein